MSEAAQPAVIAIVGPTASGKSALALRVAQAMEAEIVGTDSMQAYRGMNIGTAKPNETDQRLVRHHMIDVWPLGDVYKRQVLMLTSEHAGRLD